MEPLPDCTLPSGLQGATNMSLLFAEGGGQFHAGSVTGPGIWSTSAASVVSTIPAGRSTTWGYSGGASITPSLGAQGNLIAGFAFRISALSPTTIMGFQNSGAGQFDLRFNALGNLFFTRNGTNLGAGNPTLSANTIFINTWYYIEVKGIFATGATGTCEVVVNGVTWLTLTSVQNATTVATADSVNFAMTNGTGNTPFWRDFYVLNTSGSFNNTYLGDSSMDETFANGPGVNAQWTVQQGSFTMTAAANATGGTTVYTGTVTNGTTPTNAWQGYYFSVTGFANGANNGGPWLCTASTTTTITLQNPSGVAETHAGTVAFQNPVQIGIQGGDVIGGTTTLGTRPPSDITGPLQYIKDSTTGHKTDYAHQAITLTGAIAAVVHITFARKDDAGVRQIQQLCESGGTEELGATISLGSSLLYYSDILETDPNTGAAFTTTNFNNATFGVKQIT